MKRVIVFLIFLVLGTSLTAEENTEKKWVIEVTPYFGASELDGDVTLKGRTGSVNMSFGDIWDTLDFAFIGRVEAWKGRWGFFLDGTYTKQGANFKTKRSLVSTDLDLNITRLEFGAGLMVA